jgi:hypothetical protein
MDDAGSQFDGTIGKLQTNVAGRNRVEFQMNHIYQGLLQLPDSYPAKS